MRCTVLFKAGLTYIMYVHFTHHLFTLRSIPFSPHPPPPEIIHCPASYFFKVSSPNISSFLFISPIFPSLLIFYKVPSSEHFTYHLFSFCQHFLIFHHFHLPNNLLPLFFPVPFLHQLFFYNHHCYYHQSYLAGRPTRSNTGAGRKIGRDSNLYQSLPILAHVRPTDDRHKAEFTALRSRGSWRPSPSTPGWQEGGGRGKHVRGQTTQG